MYLLRGHADRIWHGTLLAICLLALLPRAQAQYYDGDWWTIQLPVAEYGAAPNAAPGICAAAATANSFAYLQNHFPWVYDHRLIPDLNGNGKTDPEEVVAVRDQLAYGWGDRQGYRQGIYGPTDPGREGPWWGAKVQWITDRAPGTTVFDGQEYWSDPSGWPSGDSLEQKLPEWSFLWGELAHGEDVEIQIYPGQGDAHAVTLTSIKFEDSDHDQTYDPGEARKIDYLDPNDLSRGITDARWATIGLGTGGWLEFTTPDDPRYWDRGTKWGIYMAFTESVPEPSSAALVGSFAIGLIVLTGGRRLRLR